MDSSTIGLLSEIASQATALILILFLIIMIYCICRYSEGVSAFIKHLKNTEYSPLKEEENVGQRTSKKSATGSDDGRSNVQRALDRERSKAKRSIYYCQNEDAKEYFKKFCDEFLKDRVLVKRIDKDIENISYKGIVLVIFMKSQNRNRTGDLIDLVKNITESYNVTDTTEITLVQMLFDGNNEPNREPKGMMDDSMFHKVKAEINWKLMSYTNIIYSDNKTFSKFFINNKEAAKKLEDFAICERNNDFKT